MLTFPQQFLQHVAQRPQAPAMRLKEFGIWQALSWKDLESLVRKIAGGLAEAGLERGDHVAVIGENRPRLQATMLATQALGGIPVPLYQDAAAAEYVFPLQDAKVRFAVVEDQEQVDKLTEIRADCPSLARIWYEDTRGLRGYDEPGLASLDSLIESGAAWARAHPQHFDAEVGRGSADDVASMFFTSGTTGRPKGVVHSYRALGDRALAAARFEKLTADEDILAYLPPAWIGQNIFSYAQWLACGYTVNCPESAGTVMIDLKEIGPTYYFAPPRVFESLLTSVTIRMEDASRIKRWMFDRAMALASRIGPTIMDGKPVGLFDRLLYRLADLLVYGPLRNSLGLSRVRLAYTAGEAIGPDLFRFYRSIGINLKQLYGQTETGVFVCIQPDNQVHAESVGLPIEGVEIRFADKGEILVRSPGLLLGYHNNPEATAEVLTADGWYRTGDAGFFDASGQLRIIDRSKDVGCLLGGASDGAMFAPKYVENKLKFFPFIKEAVAFGDQRATACAFINIDFEAVGNWAERRNLPYAGYTDLAAKPEVCAMVKECVDKVNADLAGDEKLAGSQITRFLVLHKELDADDGELTRTRKVRRGAIGDKYRSLVDAMYGGKSEQFIETAVKFEDGRSGSVSATLKIVDAKVFPAAPRKAA